MGLEEVPQRLVLAAQQLEEELKERRRRQQVLVPQQDQCFDECLQDITLLSVRCSKFDWRDVDPRS